LYLRGSPDRLLVISFPEAGSLPIPDYQSFMRPVLALVADGKEHDSKAVISSLADQLQLTEEERSVLLPSGKQTLLANRIHWAITYLAKAGALERTRRSHIRVTDRGRKLLEENPQKVSVKVLQQFSEFLAFHAPPSAGGLGSADQQASGPIEARA
jgi:restriction system protein